VFIELQPGELKIDSGQASYQSPGGKRFNGKMIVTNKRILCDAVFDLAAKGQMPDPMFIRWGSRGYLEMDRQQIHTVVIKKRMVGNEIEVTMKDGSKHLFSTSWWGSRKLFKSIQQV
jgi:hypothetical protein